MKMANTERSASLGTDDTAIHMLCFCSVISVTLGTRGATSTVIIFNSILASFCKPLADFAKSIYAELSGRVSRTFFLNLWTTGDGITKQKNSARVEDRVRQSRQLAIRSN